MKLIVAIVITALFIGCSPNDKLKIDHEAQQSVSVEFANYFQLTSSAKGYTLSITNPNNNTLETTIEIDTTINYKIISGSSTINGMLSMLQSQSRLVGINNIDYVYDSKIKQLFQEGNLKEVQDLNTVSVESIVATRANILFYNGYGTTPEIANTLQELNIICIPLYDWKENEPLGKAEWIKVIGALTNQLDQAISIFANTNEHYTELKTKASLQKNKPKVLAGHLWGDIWNAPAGDSYLAHLIQDGGGDYVYSNTVGTGSIQKSIEQIIKENESTDIWLNPGYPNLKEVSLNNPHTDQLKCSNQIYDYTANVNYYWERASLQPDLVLEDYIHIFAGKEDSLHFYRRVQ